jgi:hypothetical protein
MKQTRAEAARPLFHEAEDALPFFSYPHGKRKRLLRKWFNFASVRMKTAAAGHNRARFKSAQYIPIKTDLRSAEEKAEMKRAFYRRKFSRYHIKYSIPYRILFSSVIPDEERERARSAARLYLSVHGLGVPNDFPHEAKPAPNMKLQ